MVRSQPPVFGLDVIHDPHPPGQPQSKTGFTHAFRFSSDVDLALAAFGVLVLLVIELPRNLTTTRLGIAFQKNIAFRWTVYWLLSMSILVLGVVAQTEFVYFKF